jgi:hypothetical protein
MPHILQTAYIQPHKAGGKPPKLSANDKLLIITDTTVNTESTYQKQLPLIHQNIP